MTELELLQTFIFPFASAKEQTLIDKSLKLAHYTSADTAVKIIRSKNIWLRNASNMNDYLEVQHGTECLKSALRTHGQRFSQALDILGGGFASSVLQSLDQTDHNARYHTYLSCLSEHDSADDIGRLSMWRAYGGSVAGVAIIFNPMFINFDSSDLAVWTSPVLYGNDATFSKHFLTVVQNLEANASLLMRVGPQAVRDTLFAALQFAILSSKHVGFEEEKEWRLIHMPRDTASAIVQPTFESIGGAPELVYHLPLQDPFPDQRPTYNLDHLIHKVIIGPCRNPILIASTVEEALREVGVTNPSGRIALSLIPLRQTG